MSGRGVILTMGGRGDIFNVGRVGYLYSNGWGVFFQWSGWVNICGGGLGFGTRVGGVLEQE